jgi:hypothetical protein
MYGYNPQDFAGKIHTSDMLHWPKQEKTNRLLAVTNAGENLLVIWDEHWPKKDKKTGDILRNPDGSIVYSSDTQLAQSFAKMEKKVSSMNLWKSTHTIQAQTMQDLLDTFNNNPSQLQQKAQELWLQESQLQIAA